MWRREQCLTPLRLEPQFLGRPVCNPSLCRLRYPVYHGQILLIKNWDILGKNYRNRSKCSHADQQNLVKFPVQHGDPDIPRSRTLYGRNGFPSHPAGFTFKQHVQGSLTAERRSDFTQSESVPTAKGDITDITVCPSEVARETGPFRMLFALVTRPAGHR